MSNKNHCLVCGRFIDHWYWVCQQGIPCFCLDIFTNGKYRLMIREIPDHIPEVQHYNYMRKKLKKVREGII